jgi:SAM-dependent methyltransferase
MHRQDISAQGNKMHSKPSKNSIFRTALQLRDTGKLYDLTDKDADDTFRGSIDRFCLIAHELENCRKVLDIGPGTGILVSLLHELGHECYAVDIVDRREQFPTTFAKLCDFKICNVEVDPLPWPDDFFDAVVCCQALEHFSHSHLPAVKEMHRVLRPGGILELDVPNVVCFRNRSRLLRGKHITYDYEKHYLYAEPILYKGRSYFPDRHNREFTKKELEILFDAAGFKNHQVSFLKSRRYRTGLEKLKSIGTALKDAIPSFRKSLIGFGTK